MDKENVAKAWIWSGLEDLFFGFTISSDSHRPYRLFNEILGLEKILKGYLLFQNGNQYELLDEDQAKEKVINMIKRQYGHNINKMIKETNGFIASSILDEIKEKEFDGFIGQDLIRAINAGYTESRYPTFDPIYEQFKIKGKDFYKDPLESSGVTKFIYAVCREIFSDLRQSLDLSSVREQFQETYGHLEAMNRFVNLAFSGSLEYFF